MPRPPTKKPSLATVALRVGVSTATVSNTFGRPDLVSDRLRAKVLAEAARQGYAGPDPAARQLSRGGRTDTLGLLLTGELPHAFRDPAAVAFLQGLSTCCAEAGLNLLLISAAASGTRSDVIGNAVVDGFIVYSVGEDDPYFRQILDRRLPTVVVDAPHEVGTADWVGPDDRAGARAMAQVLIELGHRRVGVLTAGMRRTPYSGAAERRIEGADAVNRNRINGIRDALLSVGADGPAIEEGAENTEAAGAQALHAILDRRPDLTAVCSLMDVMALGAMKAAAERGLSVPRDLTITGYDDIPEAAVAGLTTVSQPLVDKGRIAGELYLSHRAGAAPRRRTLPTHVRARTSSGPPGIAAVRPVAPAGSQP